MRTNQARLGGPPSATPSRWGGRHRGSVLLASIVMVLIAGFSVISWLGYLSAAHHAGIRDRARLSSFYAAEAGVEVVVDFFNNPTNYQGATPQSYNATWSSHPANYPLPHNSLKPASYPLFEPYIISYARDANGAAVFENGKLLVTQWTYFRNLAAGNHAAVSKTSKIPSCFLDLSKQGRIVFKAKNGTTLSKVESIELVHPADIEAREGSLPNMRIITKAIATGWTPEGVRMSVESLITENAVYQIVSPGGIISRSTIRYNGNFEAYWGEVWANSTVELPSNWHLKIAQWENNLRDFRQGNPAKDPWFRLRTNGWIIDNFGQYATGTSVTGFSPTAPAAGTVPYTRPWDPAVRPPPPDRSPYTPQYSNMYQNQQLVFPDYPYEDWKTFVQSNGFRYFYTDTNGNMWGIEESPLSPQFGQLVSKDYATWLGSDPANPDYDAIERKIVFIDSIPTNDAGQTAPPDPATGAPIVNSEYYPRNPRTDPAARLALIRVSGQSLHTRGAIFIAADMDIGGEGAPPRWQDIPGVVKPNLEQPVGLNFRVSHNGFMYSWGSMTFTGNRTVYGSIYAERGYQGSGTPTVYYNVRLGDGSWLNLNTSRVNRTLWSFSEVKAPAGT